MQQANIYNKLKWKVWRWRINFAVVWCGHISKAAMLKYADVKLIRRHVHEEIKWEKKKSANKKNKTGQSCMSHSTRRLSSKLNFQLNEEKLQKKWKSNRGKRFESEQPLWEFLNSDEKYITPVTVQFILLKLFFRKKQRRRLGLLILKGSSWNNLIFYFSLHLHSRISKNKKRKLCRKVKHDVSKKKCILDTSKQVIGFLFTDDANLCLMSKLLFFVPVIISAPREVPMEL